MHWYLRFQIRHDHTTHTISINQCTCIEAMLENFCLTNAKLAVISMASSEQFMKDQGPLMLKQVAAMQGVPYAEVIGYALWPVMITQPDCMFAVGILLQFIQNPGNVHWEALKQVMVYMGSMKDLWLTFSGQSHRRIL